MSAQPQPQPQQPIYASDLNFLLDRHFTRFTSYIDDRFRGTEARMSGIIDQMTVDRHESQARDDILLKRIEALEATQKVIIEMQREIIATIQTMRQEIQTLHEEMKATREEIQTLREEMRDGFANQGERISELTMRVGRLERQNNPPTEGEGRE